MNVSLTVQITVSVNALFEFGQMRYLQEKHN